MSGHSKWNNIKHKKASADAAKGKIFTKIGREIAVAVKQGGPDPSINNKLRDIIAKARANNIPNDNITRSIKKASGELGSINYESITYEGYGPGGTAVIVEALTDNKNRTAGDVRHSFEKSGGNMGTTRGVIVLEKKDGDDEEEIMMTAIDCGADDFSAEDEVYEILTQPTELDSVRNALEQAGLTILSCEIDKIPSNVVALEGEQAISFQKMIDRFEDLDDVQNVFHNAQLPEEDDE